MLQPKILWEEDLYFEGVTFSLFYPGTNARSRRKRENGLQILRQNEQNIILSKCLNFRAKSNLGTLCLIIFISSAKIRIFLRLFTLEDDSWGSVMTGLLYLARPFPRTPNQLTTILKLTTLRFDLESILHLHEPHISYQRTLNGALQRLEWRQAFFFEKATSTIKSLRYFYYRICIAALLFQSRMGRRIRSANTSRCPRCQCTNSSISTVYRIGFDSNTWRMLSKKRK